MALEFAHGAIHCTAVDAVNSDKAVSGLGFAPKAIRFYWVGLRSTIDAASQTVSARRGVGFASDVSGSIVQRAVGTTSTDAAGTSDCGSIAVNNGCVVTVSAAGVIDGRLSLQSFDSDGFTLNTDDTLPADCTVFWEAWGGSDITDVTIGDIAEPAATGNQDYTATGFEASPANPDQVVMFAGVQSTAAVNTGAATDSGLCVGFGSSSLALDNCVVVGNSDDASTAMDTDGYAVAGECLAQIVVAGGNPNARAKLNGFLAADLFRVNWLARGLTNRRYIYMAIKGGSWKAGAYLINGNTASATATISGLSFAPKGVSLIGRMAAENAAGTATANDRIGLGSGSSTSSRRSMGVLDEDATASSACEIDTVIEYDQVLAFPSTTGTLQAAYDINAMNSDGFQIIVDTAGGVASEFQGYLTFGDGASSLTHYTLSTDAGSVTITGTDATFDRTFVLTATPGSFTVTGTAASLERGLRLASDSGTITITGTDATLTLGVADPRITAEAGSVSITGTVVSLIVGRKLLADPGAFIITGQVSTLSATRMLDAALGLVVITGTDADLIASGAPPTAEDRYITLYTPRRGGGRVPLRRKVG